MREVTFELSWTQMIPTLLLGSLSMWRGQCEAMVVYRYCKIITNCEINNATEKQFELDKLPDYLLVQFHLLHSLRWQLGIRLQNIC